MQVFISYARENKKKVSDEISPVLTAGGHTVWFDEQLLPGEDWKPALAKEIAQCDVFVYAATTESVRSEWCAWELGTAVRLEKAVIPVLLEHGITLPAPLDQLQWADFSAGVTGVESVKLMRALDKLQKIPVAEAPPLPADPKGVPSRAWDTFERVMDAVVTPPLYEPIEAEEVIEKYFASRSLGWDSADGRLILTNRRVLFEINRLTPFRRHFSLTIQLSEIESVVASKKFGIFFPIMTIRCQSGKEHRFSVWGLERVISRIEEQRKRVQRLT